ncbi:FAD-binding oxidoreductase [Agromyces aerolatus]|uniref:FAD-binding oxidoreductase n=1 Tax=Agromyces sp. LY-1074 TaxID=3074080 RepID=UPI00285E1453|nr:MULTISPECIES: FAD-binding oxidoreductase [unclassified Agromyces]MDR5698695.1 FAD-binding oxidoreductase [Agromyces sp. LY-1074]MDR5704989.1 FAD-binding oxidoreductase [Agromyces sp. LY-1358]
MTERVQTGRRFPQPEPITLPDEARDELIAIVGREHLLLTEAERDTYRDPYWHEDDRTYDSSAVVFPDSVEQVQAVVRVASRYEIPVWTSSQGRNNGYGGPSARVAGSLLISLRRMNRILEIDTELAYAVVEPGVRWFDLYDALHELGDELMVSVPDIGWGSVVGNSLDNGMTYLPLGSDWAAPCGLEVVLADGSLLRTGMGAIPENRSWHLYKRGLGPVLDPLFMQSNYGIVTRMGVWLMRRPRAYAPLYLSIPRDHQLGQAIDLVRELRLDGVIRGVPNIQNLITMGTQFPEHMGKFPGADPTWSEERLDRLADETGIGRWGVRTALWGDPPVVEHHLARIREAWSAIDGGRVDHLGTFTRENWGEISTFMQRISAGVPSFDMMEQMPDWVGHVGFSPIVPLTGREVVKVVDQIKARVIERTGVNFVCAVFPTNDRSAMIVSAMSFDRRDPDHVRATFDTVRELVIELGEQGYGEYRAHLDVMDLAADQYSFGDHAYRRFTEAIKDAVDPKGILSPGRHGVWPARYRDA